MVVYDYFLKRLCSKYKFILGGIDLLKKILRYEKILMKSLSD
jgi:hypothetical protein